MSTKAKNVTEKGTRHTKSGIGNGGADSRIAPTPGTVRYESTQAGLRTAEQVINTISELTEKVGSGQLHITPERQASLLLQGIGKRLQLETLKLRTFGRAAFMADTSSFFPELIEGEKS